jgi:tRNA dimethylallyltransferase
VGYKELFPVLDGEYSLERGIELVQRNTRHYAKRQMTWWGRDKSIIWQEI